MKAVVLKDVNKLLVEEIDVRKPQGDEVLVKIDVAGVCGTDVHMWAGTNYEGTFPFIPGHEWCGHLVEVGKDVKTLKVGDRVTGDNFIPCRVCEVCKRGGIPHFCTGHMGFGYEPQAPGGMAEYHWSPEERLYKIPDNVSDELGALVEVISIPFHAIWKRSGGVGPHDRVAIIGAGPVGLLATGIALLTGAQVIVVEPEHNRIKMTKEIMGADIVIDPSKDDPVKTIMDLTNGLGVSRIIECSGSVNGIAMTVDIVSVDGTIVLTGQSVGTKIPIELGKLIWRQAQIVGSCGAPYFFPATIDFISKKLIDFGKLITHRFPIDKALEAFELGNSGKAGKIMIYPDPQKMPQK